MWFALWAAWAGEAQAAWICGLSTAEIADVESHYGFSWTSAQRDKWLEAPFDCETHGDLCDMLGSADAQSLVCQMWEELVAHTEVDEIRAGVQAAIAAHEANFDYAWWVAPGACPERKSIVTDPSGDYRIKVRAFVTDLLVFREIGSSAKGQVLLGESGAGTSAGRSTSTPTSSPPAARAVRESASAPTRARATWTAS